MAGFLQGALAIREQNSTPAAPDKYIKIYNKNGTLYSINDEGVESPLTPEVQPSLTLGETSATAYRGDRGKIGYDHSLILGNPHNTSASQIPSTSGTVQNDLNLISSQINYISAISDNSSQDIEDIKSDIVYLSGAIDEILPLSASEILVDKREIGSTGTATILNDLYQTIVMPDSKEWISENLKYTGYGRWWGDALVDDGDGRYYVNTEVANIDSMLKDGWRIPTGSDYNTLRNIITPGSDIMNTTCTPDAWISSNNATNDTGFNLRGSGRFFIYWDNKLEEANLWHRVTGGYRGTGIARQNSGDITGMLVYDVPAPDYFWCSIRLVRDILPITNVQESLDYLHENKANLIDGKVPVSELPPLLSLGTTSANAFRGDLGLSAYNHAGTLGNPHQTSISNIPGLTTALGNLAPTSAIVNLTDAQSISGNKSFMDFTKLGENSPAIKYHYISGTTQASQGASTFITTNIPLSKVLGIDIVVEANSERYIPNISEGFSGVQYSVVILNNQIQVRTSSTNSSNILSAPIRGFLKYTI